MLLQQSLCFVLPAEGKYRSLCHWEKEAGHSLLFSVTRRMEGFQLFPQFRQDGFEMGFPLPEGRVQAPVRILFPLAAVDRAAVPGGRRQRLRFVVLRELPADDFGHDPVLFRFPAGAWLTGTGQPAPAARIIRRRAVVSGLKLPPVTASSGFVSVRFFLRTDAADRVLVQVRTAVLQRNPGRFAMIRRISGGSASGSCLDSGGKIRYNFPDNQFGYGPEGERIMNRTLLYRLLDTVSVSGSEEANQEIALAYGRGFAHRQLTDAVGNAVSIVNPQADFRVLLCAHMDEIGFRVTHIKEDGMIQVQRAGGVKPGLYVGAPMQIIHERVENGQTVRVKVPGVGVITDALLKKTDTEDSDLLIDIGADTREEAAAAVAVGDSVCADSQTRTLLGDRVSARALDDKSGAFVILEAARKAAESGARCGIYANTCVGEETTGRGAYLAGSSVEPDCAIVVDVTWARDCPGGDPGRTGEVRLGGGPVLCRSGTVNKKMNALLEQAAKDRNIPLQYEVAGGRTWTDGDTLLKTGVGVPVALVSIPLRYMHSSVEVADWRDLEACVELITEFLLRIGGRFDFRPIVPQQVP